MTESCGGVVYDGTALDGIEFQLIDGRIAFRGNQIESEYLDASLELLDGWFLTSDYGELIDGKLKVLGRLDDQIISGGEKISLSAIEAFLKVQFPEREIVAFAKSDAEWGDRLCLASTELLPGESIRAQLKERFGSHVSPKELITVPEIPYLSIGKPDRKKLAHDHA